MFARTLSHPDSRKSRGPFFQYVPLFFFLVPYIITCLLGALLILAGNQAFITQLRINAGVHTFVLTKSEFLINLLLLIVAPLLLSLGYFIASRSSLFANKLALPSLRKTIKINPLFPNFVFYLLATIAFVKLVYIGIFSHQSAWFIYDNFVDARYFVFSHLGFFELANIYLIIPLCAIWVSLSWKPRQWLGRFMRWVPFFIAVLLNILIFQKKPAISAEFLLMGSWCVFYFKEHKKKSMLKVFLSGLVLMVGTYAVLLLMPIIPSAIERMHIGKKDIQIQNNPSVKPQTNMQQPSPSPQNQTNEQQKPQAEKTIATASNITQQSNTAGIQSFFAMISHVAQKASSQIEFLFNYTLSAPLTRTSASALFYPIVFPAHHVFYGFDFGQDILGFGHMPDDNLVIWQYMHPNHPRGAAAAPFQFVLYSQTGLVWSLILVFLSGGLLAFLWKLALNTIPTFWGDLLGGLVLLLSLYLSLDSARDALLASYGVFWGALFILVMWVFLNFREIKK